MSVRCITPRPLLLAAAASIAFSAPALAGDAFPPATPESQGISAEALEKISDAVRGYVDRGMAVGAELVVIKNRRTVWRESFGFRDREAETPWGEDTR